MLSLSGALEAEDSQEKELASFIGGAEHYLFVLVDGLGLSFSDLFSGSGFFAGADQLELRAVFPSTTAVVLTSLATGLWPKDHGICGWWTDFPELARVVAPLTLVDRAKNERITQEGLGPEDLISGEAEYRHSLRESLAFYPKDIARAPYARWSRGYGETARFRSLSNARKRVSAHIRSRQSPSFTYLYIPDVDTQAHRTGTHSQTTAGTVLRVDRMLRELRGELPSSVRMVVSADHGLVDVPAERHFILRDENPIMKYLTVPPTAEATSPAFRLKSWVSPDEFRDAFAEQEFGDSFVLLSIEDVEALELFGPGPLSPRTRGHLGDLLGISPEPAVLEYVAAGGESKGHIGVHGGLRPEEMRVAVFGS
jgi:hypothetical protein